MTTCCPWSAWTRLPEENLNIAQVNINGLMELILKRLRPIAGKRNVELTFESIREVTADVDEMKLSPGFKQSGGKCNQVQCGRRLGPGDP